MTLHSSDRVSKYIKCSNKQSGGDNKFNKAVKKYNDIIHLGGKNDFNYGMAAQGFLAPNNKLNRKDFWGNKNVKPQQPQQQQQQSRKIVTPGNVVKGTAVAAVAAPLLKKAANAAMPIMNRMASVYNFEHRYVQECMNSKENTKLWCLEYTLKENLFQQIKLCKLNNIEQEVLFMCMDKNNQNLYYDQTKFIKPVKSSLKDNIKKGNLSLSDKLIESNLIPQSPNMIIVSYERLQQPIGKQDKDFLKDDANLPKSLSENMNYRGEEFILDAMLMVNHNKKVGETIIAGITNNNQKYIHFNVVGGQTKDKGINKFECNNILPYDWFQENTPFCINGKACEIVNQNQNKQYCFNKTIGTRIFIYVKKEIRVSLDKHKLERQDANNYSRSSSPIALPNNYQAHEERTSSLNKSSVRNQPNYKIFNNSKYQVFLEDFENPLFEDDNGNSIKYDEAIASTNKKNKQTKNKSVKNNLQSNQYKPSSSGYTIEEKTKYTSKK